MGDARVQSYDDREELAQVVVSVGAEHVPSRPWYVTLRPWLFCLFFLSLAEVAARIYFDLTLSLRHERYDEFPNAASTDVWIDQIRRDKAYRVVVLGDSVGVGANLLDPDQTIPRYLEATLARDLPGRL